MQNFGLHYVYMYNINVYIIFIQYSTQPVIPPVSVLTIEIFQQRTITKTNNVILFTQPKSIV